MQKVTIIIFFFLTSVLILPLAVPSSLRAQGQALPAEREAAEYVWTVRISSFENKDNAWAFMAYLQERGYSPTLVRLFDSKGKMWRVVQIGDYPAKSQAVAAGKSLKKQTGLSYLVRKMSFGLLKRRKAESPNTPLPVFSSVKGNGGMTTARDSFNEQLHGASEDLFYEIEQQDVLMAVDKRQRSLILARILMRRGHVNEGLRLYEKLVREYPEDLDLREEYVGTLIDNNEFAKAASILQTWLANDLHSPRAMRQDARLKLLSGNYEQQQLTLGYLLRLRPGDTDALSTSAYSRLQGGDWLGAIESFSELIDRDPENVEARQALAELLMQRRPSIDFSPSVYLQANDSVTTTLAGKFAMQLSHLTRAEIYYDNISLYRPQGNGIEKVDKVINRAAVLFRHDFTRTFTGVGGIGGYEGSAEGLSVTLGFDWRVHDPGVFSVMADYNTPWTDEPTATNYEGRYNQLSLTYDGFYDDTWGLFFNGQVRQYYVNDARLYGTRSLYNVILTRRLLADPDLFVSYSYYRSYFSYDDENYIPFELVKNESTHTISASMSKSLCDTILLQASGGVRADEFKTSLSYFGGPSLSIRMGRFEFSTGYEYSSDSSSAGGGETQLIQGGLKYVF